MMNVFIIIFVPIVIIFNFITIHWSIAKDDDGLRREDIDAGVKELRQRAQQSWLSPEN